MSGLMTEPVNDQLVECFLCENEVPESSCAKQMIYNNPFVAPGEGMEVYFCSDNSGQCEEDDDASCHDCFLSRHGFGDFNYIQCPNCDRYVCERNPDNGYQGWFKRLSLAPDDPEYDQYAGYDDEGCDDEGPSICSSCYQSYLLKHGQPKSFFDPSKIHGDFFSSRDLQQAGFSQVPDWSHKKITSTSAPDLCRRALSATESGFSIIFQYLNLSIFGDEGYISLWTRDPTGLPPSDPDQVADEEEDVEDLVDKDKKRPNDEEVEEVVTSSPTKRLKSFATTVPVN